MDGLDYRWLTFLTFLPLVGAGLTLLFSERNESDQLQIKRFALGVTVITFLTSLILLAYFDPSKEGYQFVEESKWVAGLTYKLGVDGLSFPFVLLTTFLTPLVILASWSVTSRVKEYMIAFLALETLMIGVFVSLDIVLFYLFFEGGLIPMFLIIGVWGGKDRVYASFKFFLYTLLGSVLMLVAMLWMISTVGDSAWFKTFVDAYKAANPDATLLPVASDITVLTEYASAAHKDPATGQSFIGFDPRSFSFLGIYLPAGVQSLLWLAFFASFAVKMPMWPVHTWLPDAHVQAPTAGSMVLAAILLKMGGYGLLRFSLPMFPQASADFANFVFVLSVVAIIYTSLVALAQEDMKKLIAYSSVAHMGYVTLGIFAGNQQGIDGAVFQMISHGFISAGLFMLVGVIYERAHTREISAFGGLAERMPIYAALLMLFAMANVGLPGTSGFVGEILALMGAFQASHWVAFAATSGVILSAAYMLTLYRRVALGEMTNKALETINDMTAREKLITAPLAAGAIILGVYPSLATDMFGPTTARLVAGVERAEAEAKKADAALEKRSVELVSTK
ncbi:MAG: NADH-quinone oxidoreductase subunit M [Neomegalonema sp.]|nr:NADH-quinone oxidoreductase subunit M [Neomegalonema sp.]